MFRQHNWVLPLSMLTIWNNAVNIIFYLCICFYNLSIWLDIALVGSFAKAFLFWNNYKLTGSYKDSTEWSHGTSNPGNWHHYNVCMHFSILCHLLLLLWKTSSHSGQNQYWCFLPEFCINCQHLDAVRWVWGWWAVLPGSWTRSYRAPWLIFSL